MRDKLDLIKTLNAGELQGWHRLIVGRGEPYNRPPFEGEIAALHERAKQLGVTLNEKTSRTLSTEGKGARPDHPAQSHAHNEPQAD